MPSGRSRIRYSSRWARAIDACGERCHTRLTMRQTRLHSLLLPALALSVCSLPARAASILFTDLGPPGNVYGSTAWVVEGAAAGTSYTQANLFSVSGTGSAAVNQIDLAVLNVFGTSPTFTAAIWTDNAGLPGTHVANASWSLSAPYTALSCCALVSVTGITGVSLDGGQQYFMILAPSSTFSFEGWRWNNQSVTGLELTSTDGGTTWGGGTSTLGAFDVLGTEAVPEPGTMFMLGGGLLALGFLRKRLHR
jgi:hypothetical protein